MNDTISVQCNIDRKTFRGFALFDIFIRQKRWRPLALFAGLMSLFAIVCFCMVGKKENALLLGVVLSAVGLGLPLVYIASFIASVNNKARSMKLDKSRTAYSLSLSADLIKVTSDKESVELHWPDMFAAYRVKGCIYLYADSRKAFLIPEQEQSQDVWALVGGCMSADRVHDLR